MTGGGAAASPLFFILFYADICIDASQQYAYEIVVFTRRKTQKNRISPAYVSKTSSNAALQHMRPASVHSRLSPTLFSLVDIASQ
jgi:hypothetical protein